MKYYYAKGSKAEKFYSTDNEDKTELLEFYEDRITYRFRDIIIPQRIEEISFWDYCKGITQIKYRK